MDRQDALGEAERQRLVQLALADWSDAAEARVDSVIMSSRRAAVNLFVNGGYEYSVYFQRDEHELWDEAGSASGHAVRSELEALDREA